MKIMVIGGNGKIGKMIASEALNRGHEVTLVVRTKTGEETKGAGIQVQDLFALSYEDVVGHSIVINAFGVWKPEDVYKFKDAAKHLSDILSNRDIRLLVIGSAGSLYVDDACTKMFLHTPDMPDFAIPVATEQEKALRHLQTRSDVKWTYLSPPVDFRPDGDKTGRYKLAGDRLTLSSKGESYISYIDAAIAVVDEVENQKFVNQRFSVVAV